MSLATSVIPLLSRVEAGFHFESAQKWMEAYWTLCFPISLIYVVTIFTLRSLMESRKPYGLRTTLTAWNSGLAVFSFLGATSIVPDLTQNIYTYGLEYGNCNLDGITTQRERFWLFLFALSKVIELGDTLFIVFRKTDLSFLHWYHHITVLMYCWFTYWKSHEFGMWFGGMNCLVHTIMYSYYALRSSGRKIPSIVSQIITLLQILQMFIGAILSILSLRKSKLYDCDVPYAEASVGLAMYTSYMVLFAHFFYKRYIRKNK